MKKMSILAAVCCLTLMSNAQNTENLSNPVAEITSEIEVNAELVATSDEVEVYYSSSDLSGNTLLNIHFVNTSEKAVTFAWRVEKEGSIFNSKKNVTIRPGRTVIQKSVLEMKGSFDFSEYSINLSIK